MNFKFDQKKITLGLELPLMEAFYTIQGEGFHKGSAAYFIRIGGCDCLLYTSPSPRDRTRSRMPSSA